MANKKYIDGNFDLKELVKIGFLKNSTDYDDIEKIIITWFGLDYIEQYSLIGESKEIELEPKNIFSDN